MNHIFKRQILPLLILLALLLSACVSDDIAVTQPTGQTGETQTENAAVPGITEPEHEYTEPDAPAVTFPAEPVTEPSQAPTEEAASETVPQEEVPQETYAGGPSGDENELPAIPF